MKRLPKEKCWVCFEPSTGRAREMMCEACGASYDRDVRDNQDGSQFDAMLWAANRARRFERARGQKEMKRSKKKTRAEKVRESEQKQRSGKKNSSEHQGRGLSNTEVVPPD